MHDGTQSFCVVLPNNLGDVIMATPVLEGLRKKYPHAHISFVCEQGFEAGLLHHPFCNDVILFSRKKIRDLLQTNWRAGKNELSTFVNDIASRHFDTVINLSQHTYIALLIQLFGSTTILGQHFVNEGNHVINNTWSQYLYAIPYCRSCNNLHATDVYRRIAGVKTHHGGYSLALGTSEKKWARSFFAMRGLVFNKRIIAFQPGAAMPSKRWPSDSFVKLGKKLVQDDWQIIVTGSESEKTDALTIANSIGDAAVSVAGELTFRETMALVSQCDGCVCGDTAIMHAAAGYCVTTYALFGATNPVETGPYGNGHFVFSGSCPSMPCFETHCKSAACMKSILPIDVYKCIKEQSCPASCSCNVYKTSLRENSDYALVPLSADAYSYFNASVVCLIRSIFGDHWNCTPSAVQYAYSIAEIGRWLETVSDMCNALGRYERTFDPAQITIFEVCKQSLAGFTSIGAFCTAILNVRLNSIPLLDPHAAVRQSLEVCWQTHKQVSKAIT